MRTHRSLWAAAAAAVLFAACASSEPAGPVVPVPPTIEFAGVESTLITPDGIQFVGKVVVRNQMRGPLKLSKVDYGAAVGTSPLFDDTFAELQPMRGHGKQTVTLPFQVTMKDLFNMVEDVLIDEGVRLCFRGTVTPVGFPPLDFEATKLIPMPRLPKFSFGGSRGNPLDGEFTVWLDVENTNRFPMDTGTVKTFLTLNGKRYDLLHTHSSDTLQPGGRGKLALTMHNTRGKGLGMLVNVVKNQSMDFTVGGSISFATPHGTFQLPVEVGSSPATPGR